MIQALLAVACVTPIAWRVYGRLHKESFIERHYQEVLAIPKGREHVEAVYKVARHCQTAAELGGHRCEAPAARAALPLCCCCCCCCHACS